MERVQTVVIGAGVVGLAIARRLALAGREVVALEAEGAIGTGTSSRNSEVIHAGIHYPAGSVKARTCVAGRLALEAYCVDHHIPHARPGKLIVAGDAVQRERLDHIRAAAAANGVHDLVPLTAAEARKLEPALACVGALLCPVTGIIDSHAFMTSLLGELEDAGGVVALNTPVVRAEIAPGGFVVETGGADPARLGCDQLINAAGLGAWAVAAALRGWPTGRTPPRHIAKGNYFALSGARAPFTRLIYPVPEDGGLGVHLTLDLAGRARFGPDVEWLDAHMEHGGMGHGHMDHRRIDYRVDPARGGAFETAIRRYWPDLPEGALVPDYAGARPKLSGPGAPAADFLVTGPRDHGVAGLVQLFGIESPGLTASLALAELVHGHLIG